jgi:hypothetical protein
MIPTNSLEELQRAELDLHRSQVSLIREIGKGNEKSRLHANTLQAMSSALKDVKALMQQHTDTKVPVAAVKKKAK